MVIRMRACGKNRGAVSVFLVIILVPCMMVSSLFVDMGRVQLSRNLAKSSSDLALNALLTNYDAELNQWYGMAASCQNISEFYQASAELFLRMLKSQNLTDQDILLLSGSFSSLIGDETISDLLKMECQTDKGKLITPVENANLTNSSLIKTQIVEFMKYRAPIIAATELIDKLKKDDSGVKELQEHTENSALVEAKTDYYEAEGELLAAAFNTYVALFDYTSLGATNEKLQGFLDDLAEYRSLYREIHGLMIRNLYNTEGLSVFLRPTAEPDSHSYDYTDSSISRKAETDVPDENRPGKTKKETHYYADGGRISSFLGELDTALDQLKTALNEAVSAGSGVSYIPGETCNIQYWVRMDKRLNQLGGPLSGVAEAGRKLMDVYAKLDALLKCEDGDGAPSGWREDCASRQAEAQKLQRSCLTADHAYSSGDAAEGADVSGYLEMVCRLEGISAANLDNIRADRLKISDGRTVESALAETAQGMRGMRETLQSYVDALDTVIDGNPDEDIVSLDDLRRLAQKYSTSLTTWDNTAQNTDTGMGEQDRNIISGHAAEEKDNLSEYCKKINEAAVNELKTRLLNIRGQIQGVLDAADSLAYGGEALSGIEGYGSFRGKAAAAVDASRIGLTDAELEGYASETLRQLFTPYSETGEPVGELKSGDAFQAELDPRSERVNIPKLYQFLHTKFDGRDKREIDKEKKSMDDAKDKAGEKEKSAKDRKANPEAKDIERSFSPDGRKFNMGVSLLTTLTGLIGKLLDGNIAAIRDNLYVGTYMMEMFSYAAFENEGLYGLTEDKKSLTPENCGERYSLLTGAADRPGTWLSADPRDGYNKSLTNRLINKENNSAYGCELEYILYGGGNGENVKAAYSDIYTIRYALNLVSAFQNFWSPGKATGNVINTIAASIASTTFGIIPAALVKVVILSILTIFETSYDLDRLEKGFPVELYKQSGDWVLSLEGAGSFGDIISTLSGGSFQNKDKGLQYSDYIMLFVHLGLQSDTYSEAMYLRMAEVIEANMRNITKNEGYALKNAQVYFRLNADLDTPPLMMKLPLFQQYYDEGLDKNKGWCSFRISTVRGYS